MSDLVSHTLCILAIKEDLQASLLKTVSRFIQNLVHVTVSLSIKMG